jgi:hypothetical protein
MDLKLKSKTALVWVAAKESAKALPARWRRKASMS